MPMPPSADLVRRLLERQEYDAALDLLSTHLTGTENTRKTVLSGWRVLLRWVESNGEGLLNLPDPEEFARAYAGWLEEAYGGVASSVNNRLTQARRLFQVLEKLRLVKVNPFWYVRGRVNQAHERRQAYTPAEVERLLAHASVEDTVLILLGAHAGLTGSELLALTWADVREDRGLVCLPGRKVRQEDDDPLFHVDRRARSIPCTPPLQQALQALAAQHGETPLLGEPAHGLLFTLEGKPLTGAQLRARVYWLCQKAGVPYKAWRALRNAAGVRLLQEEISRDRVTRTLGVGGRMALRPALKLAGRGDGRKEQAIEWARRKKERGG